MKFELGVRDCSRLTPAIKNRTMLSCQRHCVNVKCYMFNGKLLGCKITQNSPIYNRRHQPRTIQKSKLNILAQASGKVDYKTQH